jgi:hypothetical protein
MRESHTSRVVGHFGDKDNGKSAVVCVLAKDAGEGGKVC